MFERKLIMYIRNYEGMVFPLPEYDYTKNDKFVLYGTGEVARSYYKQLVKKIPVENIMFFIDSMSNEKELFGKKIYRPESLDKEKLNDYKYMLCTFTSAVGMENELLKIGINVQNIIKSSKYTLDSFIKFKMSGNKVCLYPMMDKESYKKIKHKIKDYVLPQLDLKMDVVLKENSKNIDDIKPISIVESYQQMSNYDLILVWNKKNLQDEIINGLDNVFCIDENFFQYIDIKLLAWLDYKLLSKQQKEKITQISQRNFVKLIEKKYSKSYVFGTGPSMEDGMRICLEEEKDDNIYKIVCNGAIRDKYFMEKLKPNIYTLSDSFFIDRDNIEYITKIVNYINENDIYLCIPAFWIPLYIYKYKLNEDKVIGFSEMRSEIFFPSENCLELYSKAHNVITKYAVPIASALSDSIYISGCDGAKKEEGKMIFEHLADDKQVLKKMEVLNHYAYFKQIIEYGERLHKVYKTITNSYIPVLKHRLKK